MPRDQHNQKKLKEINTPENPVAKIKAITTKYSDGTRVHNNSHYDSERTPPATLLCCGAKVQLSGRNIKPEWGLFNGSIGTVRDIVYNDNENPNHDELPKYILVEFTQYKGPILVPDNPLLVPIPPMEVNCNRKRCCRRKYVPLVLAFAKTVHTFQGQNVGPVQPGQSPNAFEKIIADPGAKSFEGTNPGLFYSTTSRGTTIGTKEKKFLLCCISLVTI